MSKTVKPDVSMGRATTFIRVRDTHAYAGGILDAGKAYKVPQKLAEELVGAGHAVVEDRKPRPMPKEEPASDETDDLE